MARRLFASPLPPAGPAKLSQKLGHYLGRIARTKPGETVVLFDGKGGEVTATVLEVHTREVLVDVGPSLCQPIGRSPRMALDVACALPRSSRADWLFEHGTEAGIRSFRPILTEHMNRRHEEHARWQRVLIQACAQCDRAVLPTIEPTVTLAQLCTQANPDERYVATRAPMELGAATSAVALLVIGPEGGLTDSEVQMLVEAGFLPRSLGPLTLRTETAVLAGATRLLQGPFAAG